MIDSVTIKMFLPKGNAKSLRIAEISNWSGKGVAAPRSELKEFLERPELMQAGVYILNGTSPEDGEPLAYIGEAEVLKDRLKNHHSNKDFWNQVVVFVSKDENLTKAHVRFLESLMINEALKIGKTKLDNAQNSNAKLPESDSFEILAFLQKIKQLLPVLGFDLLTPIISSNDILNKTDVLSYRYKDLVATGNRTSSGFVVYKDSEAAIKSSKKTLIEQRNSFTTKGILIENNGKLIFTKDVEFSSPSAAASLITGRATSGLVCWKDKQGRTLKELES